MVYFQNQTPEAASDIKEREYSPMDQEQIAHFERLFSSLSQRMDQRFDAVDQRFDAVDQRFDAVDQRFDGVDQRLDKVEIEAREAHILIEGLREEVKMVAEGVADVREELQAHKAEVNARFDKVDKRLLTIEAYAHTSYEDLNSRIPKRQSAEPTGL